MATIIADPTGNAMSGKDLLHDISVNIGQTEIATGVAAGEASKELPTESEIL
jgi:hypothetical protein